MEIGTGLNTKHLESAACTNKITFSRCKTSRKTSKIGRLDVLKMEIVTRPKQLESVGCSEQN